MTTAEDKHGSSLCLKSSLVSGMNTDTTSVKTAPDNGGGVENEGAEER